MNVTLLRLPDLTPLDFFLPKNQYFDELFCILVVLGWKTRKIREKLTTYYSYRSVKPEINCFPFCKLLQPRNSLCRSKIG